MLTQGTRVLDTNSLAIETTAKLDLNDNDLIVRSGNLTTVTGQIKTGLENGGSFDWKGLGIGSTRAGDRNATEGTGFLYGLGVLRNNLDQVGGSGPVYTSFGTPDVERNSGQVYLHG